MRFPMTLVALVAVGVAGCSDPALQLELQRAQDQLKQADRRLEVSVSQLHAANQQVAGLKDSLLQSRGEIEELKSRMAEQANAYAHQESQLQAELAESRRDVARARQQLLELMRAQVKEEQQFSILGVWEMAVGANKYRFAFYDDGKMIVRQFSGGGYWLEPRAASAFAKIESEYPYRHIEGNSFVFGVDPTKKSTALAAAAGSGKVLIDDKDAASILIDIQGETLFRDGFGKPKWIKLRRVEGAQTP